MIAIKGETDVSCRETIGEPFGIRRLDLGLMFGLRPEGLRIDVPVNLGRSKVHRHKLFEICDLQPRVNL